MLFFISGTQLVTSTQQWIRPPKPTVFTPISMSERSRTHTHTREHLSRTHTHTHEHLGLLANGSLVRSCRDSCDRGFLRPISYACLSRVCTVPDVDACALSPLGVEFERLAGVMERSTLACTFLTERTGPGGQISEMTQELTETDLILDFRPLRTYFEADTARRPIDPMCIPRCDRRIPRWIDDRLRADARLFPGNWRSYPLHLPICL